MGVSAAAMGAVEIETIELTAGRPGGWVERTGCEPLLRIALRAAGARAGWLRVGEDLHVVTQGEALPRHVATWLVSLSRRAAHAASSDVSSGSVRVLSRSLQPEGSSDWGSIGLMLVEGVAVESDEVREVLDDLVRGVQSQLALCREASAGVEAVHKLNVLGRAVANMQLGVTITGPEGRIVFTNPAEARMHGYEPHELIGQPASLLAPPTLRKTIYMEGDRADRSWTRETVNRHRDGREFPVLLWSDVIEDQDGSFNGMVTCSEDLTQRYAFEAAIRRSESMFRAIFENAPVGLALLGDDGWIVRANPLLRSMLRLTNEPEPERRITEYVHPADLRATESFYTRALRDSPDPVWHEHRLGAADGEILWVHVTVSPILDANGRGQLWIAMIEDTTARHALEEQLRHSQKMEAVGRLAGGVAHDFNNLLTAIRGTAELLLLEAGTSHPMAADIQEIHKAAGTAAELTRQLLAFSRRQVTHTQPQNVNAVLLDCEGVLRRLLSEGIELRLDLAGEVAPILGDQSQIEQVILNLLVNARDAMPEGGTVVVRTSNVGGSGGGGEELGRRAYVQVTVEDTGSGIDPATLPHIFDPFFTTKQQGRGTGLGLSTVYGIVKQNGGEIWVESEVGEGTTFRVWFPAIDPGHQILPGFLLDPVRTILAFRQDETRRALTCDLLEDRGYRVLAPSSPTEARHLAETYGDRIHLLLVDRELDGGCGLDLARAFCEVREDMEVLVITDGSGEEGGAGGDCGFPTLCAGAAPEVLLDAISTLLGER